MELIRIILMYFYLLFWEKGYMKSWGVCTPQGPINAKLRRRVELKAPGIFLLINLINLFIYFTYLFFHLLLYLLNSLYLFTYLLAYLLIYVCALLLLKLFIHFDIYLFVLLVNNQKQINKFTDDYLFVINNKSRNIIIH